VVHKDAPSRFWDKWYYADELYRLELVQQLTGVSDHATAVLTNSYLVDLASYLEETLNAQKGGKDIGQDSAVQR